jgi:RHS repeat-associated protein
MRKFKMNIWMTLLVTACTLSGVKGFSQTYASPAQKDKALYIDAGRIAASEARRGNNNNQSVEALVMPEGPVNYSIDGPFKVEYGSQQSYSLVPRAPQGCWWYIGCGTSVDYFDDLITVQFNVTACNYCDIMLFSNTDELLTTYRVNISGNSFPLSAGRISTGSQSVYRDSVAGSLTATPASGGNCGSNYQYQWQYSFNDSVYRDVDSATGQHLTMEGGQGQDVYFRRRVICATDTLFTGSVAVFLIRPLDGGTVTSYAKAVAANTIPGAVNATAAQNGECNNGYAYQWQQSANGQSFNNINGATGQNYTFNSPIADPVFLRRKTICAGETAYTAIVEVRISNTPVAAATSEIDSMLADAKINLDSLLNIIPDSLANSRLPANDPEQFTYDNYERIQQGFMLKNGRAALDSAGLLAIDSITLQDNIAARMTDSAYNKTLSVQAFLPFIDEALIQPFRSTGNYAGLDSIVNLGTRTSFEELSLKIENDLQNNIAPAERTYSPSLLFNTLLPGAVINGPLLVQRNIIYRYTANFYFALTGASAVNWTVYGGIVVAQNNNPANGPLYADVKFTTATVNPFVGVFDLATNQYGVLGVYYAAMPCMVYPVLQNNYYGQQPANLQAADCSGFESVHHSDYEWQVLDVYGNGTWAGIAGTNTQDYQPPALNSVWLMYRRITKNYDAANILIDTKASSAASIKLLPVDAGLLSCDVTHLPFNAPPQIINKRAATGGYTTTGYAYTYTWEYAVGNSNWQTIGTGVDLPAAFTVQYNNTRIRRRAEITGINTAGIPVEYIKASTAEIKFTMFYQTVDYENRTYVRESSIGVKGINTWQAADLLTSDKRTQFTTYLDGLGRPIQLVNKGSHYNEQTNEWWDMAKYVKYETGGRIDKAWLSYPTTANFGKYKTDAPAAQTAYYQNKFGENLAYAKVEYERSPENRLKKAMAPGSSWVGSNIGNINDYGAYSGTENVQVWTAGANAADLPVNKGVYPNLFLYKTIVKDEKGKTVISYINRLGQTVLTKVQLAEGAGLSSQHNGWLCTYYVYDGLNQLRYEITPKAVDALQTAGWVFNSTIADELCFSYEYDEYGRQIAKKTPGKGKEYFVYDRRHRPVFTQDANQFNKSPKEWYVRLYDEENREILTGLYRSNASRADLQLMADNAAPAKQSITTTSGGTVKLWGSPLTEAVLNGADFTQLSFSYFDNYFYTGVKDFQNNVQLSYTGGPVEPFAITKRTEGEATGARVKILDETGGLTGYLTSTIYYDEEGRPQQTLADNVKQGVDRSTLQYHFDGRLLSTETLHKGIGTPYASLPVLTKIIFNKARQAVGIAKKINDNTRSYAASTSIEGAQEDAAAGYKPIARYQFNELGQRVKKVLSPDYNGGQGLESLDYSYNLRGWLTGINKDYALGEFGTSQWEHFFGMYLGYDNKDGQFAAPQYNGNLTGVQWKSQGDNVARKYDYNYDNANRFTGAGYKQKASAASSWDNTKADFSISGISYDLNGNLLGMTHRSVLPGAASPVNLDQLAYTYRPNSNILLRVSDNSQAGSSNGKLGDFKDGVNTGDDYVYDNNGNITTDQNRGVSAAGGPGIRYNYLDKPVEINISNKGTIKYVYDAAGNKLQKTVTTQPPAGGAAVLTTTTYIGAYVYEKVSSGGSGSENLAFIQHEEGRIRLITPYNNPADPANQIGGGIALPGGKQGVFDYYIKDQLGNVRVTITEELNKTSMVCTMEDAVAAIKQQEEAQFGNPGGANEVSNTRSPRPNGWTSGTVPPLTLAQNQKVAQLVATGGSPKIGPNALVRVMAGDKVSARSDYYYVNNPGSGGGGGTVPAMVANLLSALSGGRSSQVVSENAVSIGSSLNSSPDLASLLADNSGGNTPKAYLNYLFFDEQFNFVPANSGYKRVQTAGNGAAPLVVTDARATKNGYVYIYLSNESAEPVHFDNFTVSHERGRLIEENHYYAYGLKIAPLCSRSISGTLKDKDAVKKGYQGAFAEEVTDFDLGYNEFDLRNYDPQIGRWLGADPYDEFASPYTGMGNDPINNNDPTGGFTGGIGCNWGAAACNPFLMGATKGASMAGMGLAFMGHISNFSLYANAGNSILQQQPPGDGSSNRDNPSIIGIKAHQALASYLNDQNRMNGGGKRWLTEVVLDSKLRPDIIDNQNKKVWELKPISWNPWDIATGAYRNYIRAKNQLKDYVSELNQGGGIGLTGTYSAGGTAMEIPVQNDQIIESLDGTYVFTFSCLNPASGIIFYSSVKKQQARQAVTESAPAFRQVPEVKPITDIPYVKPPLFRPNPSPSPSPAPRPGPYRPGPVGAPLLKRAGIWGWLAWQAIIIGKGLADDEKQKNTVGEEMKIAEKHKNKFVL